mmetsp:Transcript_105518/g.336005  ORF Transcript_105518/g.336005 Transcript_105518/m.336005 type:complete len:220 (+) Transcript_105518:63-722(+)
MQTGKLRKPRHPTRVCMHRCLCRQSRWEKQTFGLCLIRAQLRDDTRPNKQRQGLSRIQAAFAHCPVSRRHQRRCRRHRCAGCGHLPRSHLLCRRGLRGLGLADLQEARHPLPADGAAVGTVLNAASHGLCTAATEAHVPARQHGCVPHLRHADHAVLAQHGWPSRLHPEDLAHLVVRRHPHAGQMHVLAADIDLRRCAAAQPLCEAANCPLYCRLRSAW